MVILEQSEALYQQLSRTGAFLCAGDGVMTVGWGAFGIFWGKPCAVAAVRKSRHTYGPLAETGAFTLCIPFCDMDRELRLAGTLSGRDGDKWAACGLHRTLVDGLPAVQMEHGLILNCRTLVTTDMQEGQTDPSILPRFYQNGDLHTMFFAEVTRETLL